MFDYYGDQDASLGGVQDDLYILKYNAMRYSNSLQFAQSLQRDLTQLIDFEFRCSGPKLIKTLRMEQRVPSKAKTREAEQMLEADTTEVIIA